jgi:signal transduction histidine kinase
MSEIPSPKPVRARFDAASEDPKGGPAARSRIGRIFLATGLAWTLFIGGSAVWKVFDDGRLVLTFARRDAKAAFEQDLLFRRWVAGHGGIYVPPTPANPPNPLLAGVPDRDIRTTSGRELTLVNPAWATRQLYELAGGRRSAKGRITSLSPLRPENAPDPWERKALEKVARGEKEFSEIVTADGAPVLRFLGPLVTEPRCLKCHASQGYAVGSVRGGLSYSIPLGPYREHEERHRRKTLLAHGGIWLIGISALFVWGRKEVRNEREREEARRKLRRAEESLGAAQRLEAIGRLAGGVAHDLNNFLAPIVVHAELLGREFPPGSDQLEDVEGIRSCAERAASLVRQLLAFGRQQTLSMRPTDLSKLVAEVTPMLERVVGRGVRIETDLDPALPPVEADAGQIEISLVNLSANSRDELPGGGTIRLGTRIRELSIPEASPLEVPPGRYVELTVEDDGPGIPDELLPRIFEPFFTTKEPGRGTGLGLPSVHGVVRQHRGAIVASNRPGGGAVFRILLPVKPEV